MNHFFVSPLWTNHKKVITIQPMKANDLLRLLARHGVTVIKGRGKGGHVIVRFNGKQSTVSTGSGEIPRLHVQTILKQLGIDPDDLDK